MISLPIGAMTRVAIPGIYVSDLSGRWWVPRAGLVSAEVTVKPKSV